MFAMKYAAEKVKINGNLYDSSLLGNNTMELFMLRLLLMFVSFQMRVLEVMEAQYEVVTCLILGFQIYLVIALMTFLDLLWFQERQLLWATQS